MMRFDWMERENQMSYKTQIAFSLLAWLGTSLPLIAATTSKRFAEPARELIETLERLDPLTKKKTEEWQRIRQALKNAGEEAESNAGFRLSINHILHHWDGRGLRVLDDSEAQYFAWHSQAPLLREAGAWFTQKGSKWYVRQLATRPGQPLRRGDAIVQRGFHPVQFWTSASSQMIRVQDQPLAPEKDLSIRVREVALDNWALEETQASSTPLNLGGKRLCQERVWMWLTQAVGTFLHSKVRFAQETCDALLVDLRSSFGSEIPQSSLKGKKAIPVVVLVNEETREGAVSFALRLKDELGATVIGEPTASRLLPQEKVELKSLPWLILVYESARGSLLPDQTIKDTWLASGGLDPLYESGVSQLKERLKL
jgi:hypothetical protein